MACGNTNIGGVFSISTTAQNETLDLSGFEGLAYTEVGGLINHGPVGIETNMVSDSGWDDVVECFSKGLSNGGTPDLEFRDAPSGSAGLDAMRAAGLPTNNNSYAFKVEWPNGKILYWRGPIGGPVESMGAVEDNQHLMFAARNNQVPVRVDAPTP